MEILIIAVMAIISMLVKGKKPDNAQSQQQPQRQRQPSPQAERPDPMKKLKEMSQEMYKEIQREFQTEIEEPPSRQAPPVSRPKPAVSESKPVVPQAARRMPVNPIEKAPASERKLPERSSNRESGHRGRLSVHGGNHVWEEPVEHHEMIPKSERDLIKGIIFSEILGPPKSKQ